MLSVYLGQEEDTDVIIPFQILVLLLLLLRGQAPMSASKRFKLRSTMNESGTGTPPTQHGIISLPTIVILAVLIRRCHRRPPLLRRHTRLTRKYDLAWIQSLCSRDTFTHTQSSRLSFAVACKADQPIHLVRIPRHYLTPMPPRSTSSRYSHSNASISPTHGNINEDRPRSRSTTSKPTPSDTSQRTKFASRLPPSPSPSTPSPIKHKSPGHF